MVPLTRGSPYMTTTTRVQVSAVPVFAYARVCICHVFAYARACACMHNRLREYCHALTAASGVSWSWHKQRVN
jgi:hypothetical protein